MENRIAGYLSQQGGENDEFVILVIFIEGGLMSKHTEPNRLHEAGYTEDKEDACDCAVCGLRTEGHTISTDFQNQTYSFCCEECKKEFERTPMHFISQ